MDNAGLSSVPGMKSNALLCLVLLCIVGIEVLLTYQHLSTKTLLLFLLVLAAFEAAIAVTYFMHLKYERPNLAWSLIPALLFVLFMMGHMLPDAMRLVNFRVIHW
jgi:heme/copper-type cytochrome/quinol oxidase subunit 4